jgi:excinuclease UvrABC nuclease subunit
MKDLNYRPVLGGTRVFAAWLLDLKNQSGAYVIRSNKTKEILYVGESHTSRLAATIRRHFHHWNDTPDRKHFTYSPHHVEVAVRLTPPPAALGAQNNLIQRMLPRDNTTGYGPAEKPF